MSSGIHTAIRKMRALGRRFSRSSDKRRLVTLHHLACSGGTIMTKSLAAMPGTMVLSEIHPDRPAEPAFHPLCQIRRGYNDLLTFADRMQIREHFRNEIVIAHEIASAHNRQLIVRDHAHVDFAWRGGTRSALVDEVSDYFEIVPILTMRNPREVWVSLQREGWFDGQPEDLCRAHLSLLDAFPDAPVFFYEDFARKPDEIVRKMCDAAGVTYLPDFQSRLNSVTHLTGDSGRASSNIEPRTPKPLGREHELLFRASKSLTILEERIDRLRNAS